MSDPHEPASPEGTSGEQAPPPPAYGSSPYGAVPDGGSGDVAPPAYGVGQPGAEGPYRPTEAISYGWRKFSASPATLLIPMIVVFVGIVFVSVLVEILILGTFLATHECTRTGPGTQIHTQCGPGFVTRLIGAGVAAALINLVAQVLAAGLYKGATHVTDGRSFTLGELFDGWDKAQVVVASLIIAAATFVGTVLCYLPGIVVGFLAQFTVLFIVDKQLGAVDAIRASVKLVTDNLGQTLVFYLLAIVVLIVGAILCGIGLLVAAPVALIGLAYTFRRLQGEPVVP
jgi:hypothetical protein